MGAEALRQPLAKTRKSGLSHFFDTDYIVTSSTSYLGRYGYLRVAYTF